MSPVYLFCFLTSTLTGVIAINKEELKLIRDEVQPHMVACAKELDVSEGDVEDAKKNENVDGIEPCFLSCVLKALGTLDSDGKVDPDSAIEKSKKILTSEEDRLKFEGIIKTCTKVNDEEVSDGEKGCERAKHLVTCIIENKGEFMMPH